MKADAPSPRLLMLDSGIGGLSILKEIRRALPQVEVVYLADTAAFPHSDQDGQALVARLTTLLEVLLDAGRPDMVLVTGSTASSLALAQLQARFELPVLGCQPPLEAAVALTQTGCVGLLETETTLHHPARGEWIERVAAGCRVVRVGARRLAGLAERRFRGLSLDRALLARESDALFAGQEEPKPDAVALGSPHYWFLLEELRRLGPPDTLWLEPGVTTTRRVQDLAASLEATPGRRPLAGGSLALFTRLSATDRKPVEKGCAAFGLSRVLALDPLSSASRQRLTGWLADA